MYEKKKTKKNYYSTITFPSSKMFQLLIILQTLFYCNVFVTAGVSVTDSVIIKAIVLDMSVDAPARSMWQVSSSIMVIVAVDIARRLANTLTLVLVKETGDECAMSTHSTKLLLLRQDMQEKESMKKSNNKRLRH